jgi:hypothetical protein
MNRFVLAIAACSISLAAMGSAAAAPKFEGATTQGSPVNNPGFFRIDVATGQTWQAWGGVAQYAPVVDSAPIPAGDYHLLNSSWVSADGKVSWSLYRLDQASGRAWVALGGGGAPLVWTELVPPK